jgi:DNA-binding transcriptional ArsR family regulator
MVDARLFQALSDPTRLRILLLLSRSTMNVTSIVNEVKTSQPAVSRHLRVLREASLINHVRKGKEIEYSLNLPQLRDAGLYIEALTGGAGQAEGPEVVELAVPAAGSEAEPEAAPASASKAARTARAARSTRTARATKTDRSPRAKKRAARPVSEEQRQPAGVTPPREYTIEREEEESMDDFLL